MDQLFILILLFSMDFSCHSEGSTMPYFGIGGQNILNTEAPSNQSDQKPLKGCLSYVINSESPSSMLSNAASLAVNSQSSPQSLESTQHTAVNTHPINPAANEPTTPSALSFTQAADAKWTEYTLRTGYNKRKYKTSPAFKNPSIFAYNKASGELNSPLQRTQVPVHSVNPPQSSSAGKKKIVPKLVILDPRYYNDKGKVWKREASITPF